MTSQSKQGQYRAKTLAAAAGISANLLRAWERRYPLFEPERRPGGQRLYTEKDLRVLRRIRELLDSGLSIGEAAALGREGLLGEGPPQNVVLAPVARQLSPLDPAREKLIFELAPPDLRPRRSTRYAGEELGVSLRSLHPGDLATLYRLYRTLKSLYEVWLYMEQQLVRQVLLGRLGGLFEASFVAELHSLGAATPNPDVRLRNALEDSRRGALSVLMDYCRERDLNELSLHDLRVLLTLARDHAKMMRNAFVDLDEVVREADETPKAHSLQPVLLKWLAFQAHRGEFKAGTTYQGPISSRCLETSALDRILYHFFERTLGPAGTGAGLWVTQVNDLLCRWAVECSVERFAPFEVEELPVQAMALAMGVTPDEVLSYAYLGSGRRAGRLWAWFHWPVFRPTPEVPHCHCEPLAADEFPLSADSSNRA